MIRNILVILIPLIAPTLAYIAFIFFTRRNREAEERGEALPPWRLWPWARLISIGGALSIVALVSLNFVDPDAGSEDDVYVPARVEDGVIVPGYFKEKPVSSDSQ